MVMGAGSFEFKVYGYTSRGSYPANFIFASLPQRGKLLKEKYSVKMMENMEGD